MRKFIFIAMAVMFIGCSGNTAIDEENLNNNQNINNVNENINTNNENQNINENQNVNENNMNDNQNTNDKDNTNTHNNTTENEINNNIDNSKSNETNNQTNETLNNEKNNEPVSENDEEIDETLNNTEKEDNTDKEDNKTVNDDVEIPEEEVEKEKYDYIISEDVDKFTGDRTCILINNILSKGDYSYGILDFGLGYLENEDSKNLYIMADYYNKDWIFIREDESVRMLIDGQKLFLDYIDITREVKTSSGVYIKENIFIPLEFSQLKQIAYANEVELQLNGSEGKPEFRFNKGNFVAFQEFYERFIKPNVED